LWLTGRLAPDHKTIADFRKDDLPPLKRSSLKYGLNTDWSCPFLWSRF